MENNIEKAQEALREGLAEIEAGIQKVIDTREEKGEEAYRTIPILEKKLQDLYAGAYQLLDGDFEDGTESKMLQLFNSLSQLRSKN